MQLVEKQLLKNLQFQWMKFTGPKCLCTEIIHPGISCSSQIYLKFRTVLKTVSKFYLLFHLIPFAIKLRKAIQQKRFINYTFKTLISCLGSILFIAHLVIGLKTTICTFANSNCKNSESFIYFIYGNSIINGVSILWQSKSRRQQIAYYTFVRSIRAVYTLLLRRNLFTKQIPKQVFFVILFGFLSYAFFEKQQNFKYANVFKKLWGQI